LWESGQIQATGTIRVLLSKTKPAKLLALFVLDANETELMI
jgi:hypothetical protein